MYQDPAFNPHRQILGSDKLGSAATVSDNSIIEISKLGNGVLNSLSTIFGADKLANHFQHNVDVLRQFQERSEAANPIESKIGKYIGIGEAALLTTPAFGSKLGLSMGTGVAGGLSSAYADAGSNALPPGKEALSFATGLGTGSGMLGGGVATMLTKGLLHTALPLQKALVPEVGKVIEAPIEGTDPRLLYENR